MNPSYRLFVSFLFFPVLRRGSDGSPVSNTDGGFYSSPSCDGDHVHIRHRLVCNVSILPRLATGISAPSAESVDGVFLFFPVLRRGSVICESDDTPLMVSILPRLATGIAVADAAAAVSEFLFFPVLRRGSLTLTSMYCLRSFYSSPSCDGDPYMIIVP